MLDKSSNMRSLDRFTLGRTTAQLPISLKPPKRKWVEDTVSRHSGRWFERLLFGRCSTSEFKMAEMRGRGCQLVIYCCSQCYYTYPARRCGTLISTMRFMILANKFSYHLWLLFQYYRVPEKRIYYEKVRAAIERVYFKKTFRKPTFQLYTYKTTNTTRSSRKYAEIVLKVSSDHQSLKVHF